jgi:hypothetical protein
MDLVQNITPILVREADAAQADRLPCWRNAGQNGGRIGGVKHGPDPYPTAVTMGHVAHHVANHSERPDQQREQVEHARHVAKRDGARAHPIGANDQQQETRQVWNEPEDRGEPGALTYRDELGLSQRFGLPVEPFAFERGRTKCFHDDRAVNAFVHDGGEIADGFLRAFHRTGL